MPTASPTARPAAARQAAQRAFFDLAASNKAPEATAPVAAAAPTRPQAAVQRAIQPDAEPTKILRPGSLLNIRV